MIAALNRPVGRREILIATAAGAVLVALAVLLVRGSGAPAGPGVAVDAPAPAPPAPPAVAPPPAPAPAPDPAAASPAVPAAPPADPATVAGLRLRGVLGGSAIIEVAGGRQLLARVGRAVAPGVTLAAVGRDHVLLDSGGQQLRLGFGDGSATAVAAAAAPSAPAARPAAAGAVVPGLADAAREADRAYVIGLRPVEVNGRTTGYRVEPGTRMPGLVEAGLQPGDIIRTVNGVDFTDEERVTELGDEIAGSYELIVEFERGGQRMTRTVAVNPRPAPDSR